MADINQVFDKVYYINRRTRPDRNENMKKRLAYLGIEAERFEAVYGGSVEPEFKDFGHMQAPLNFAEQGCFLSHRAIYQLIKDNQFQKTLILEDDALFKEGFISYFDQLSEKIPGNWDLLYFGQFNYDTNKEGKNRAIKEPITDFKDYNIHKASRCWLTHAYAVNIGCINKIIEGTSKMYKSIDGVLADVQESLNVYAFYPSLIKQDDTKSCLRIGVKTTEI